MEVSDVERIATGLFYLGEEAKELGLVDGLGGREEALDYIAAQQEIEPNVIEYRRKATFLDALTGVMGGTGFNIGRGFAFELRQIRQTSVIPAT